MAGNLTLEHLVVVFQQYQFSQGQVSLISKFLQFSLVFMTWQEPYVLNVCLKYLVWLLFQESNLFLLKEKTDNRDVEGRNGHQKITREDF